MGSQISSLGWVLIILLIMLIVSLYLSLYSKLKNKETDQKTGWITSIRSAGKSIKDPFWYENSKMQELANSVEKLQQKTSKEKMQNTGSSDAGDPK